MVASKYASQQPLFRQAQAALRTEPGTADMFYLVQRGTDGTGYVSRFQRNVGGNGATDAGVSWPEFRVTGSGFLTNFNLPVAANVTWIHDEPGAIEFVCRNTANTKTFLSYHGVGANGALTSETIEIDGIAIDHEVANEGNSFELRNDVTADDGTSNCQRDLSWLSVSGGNLKVRLNAIPISSDIALFYYGMPISTGNGYSELLATWASIPNMIDLGTSLPATAIFAGTDVPVSLRHRDPTTGYFLGATGTLNALANYVQYRTEKETTNQRTKTYLGQFSSAAALNGAEITFEWGTTTAGATAPPAQMLSNTLFTSPSWSRVQSNSTVVDDGAGTVTMTWASGTSNARTHMAIGSAIGQKCIISLEMTAVTGAGTREFYIGSNSNGSNTTPAPAYSMTVSTTPLRIIGQFTGTVAVPEQRFAIRHAATAGATSSWKNPSVFARV